MFLSYLELTKPSITTLVLVTAAFSFHLAGGTWMSMSFFWLMLGSALVSGGAGALNHYWERELDPLMKRTSKRPLPTGKIKPMHALLFGTLLATVGVTIFFYKINYLTALLGLMTVLLYVFVYTPMKRLTWLNTLVGAIPGAIPALGGGAAATGHIGAGDWFLFFIVFLWQHPHFYVIAWMCREEYAKAGFKMLPMIDHADGRWTFFNIFFFMFLLIAATITPFMFKFFGLIYLTGVMIAGFFLFAAAMSFLVSKSREDAVGFLKATVYYLPAVFISIALDRWILAGVK